MSTPYAQCLGAGQRFCSDCRRNVDNNAQQQTGRYQPMVGPTTSDRCAHWLAIPAQKGRQGCA